MKCPQHYTRTSTKNHKNRTCIICGEEINEKECETTSDTMQNLQETNRKNR